jgi:cytidylate kinase
VTSRVIAIDGAAATGKSTSAAGVAEALGFLYVDSGALYRAVALAVLDARAGDPDSPSAQEAIRGARIGAESRDGAFRVDLDGRDVTNRLRSPEVSHLASVLATRRDVRDKVVDALRRLAQGRSVVVEGRDIATVVFPDAALKVFLVADGPERARRRWAELRALGRDVTLEQVQEDLEARDRRDAGRPIAPLKRHPDAVEVDTTRLTVPEQIDRIVRAYRQRAPGPE